jgi:condensin complex subunit 2
MRSLGANKEEEMSFQDLVCDINSEQKQKDVSLPFYFLCLLHLANEKVRAI